MTGTRKIEPRYKSSAEFLTQEEVIRNYFRSNPGGLTFLLDSAMFGEEFELTIYQGDNLILKVDPVDFVNDLMEVLGIFDHKG